jgi:hypothetical protein
MNVLYTIAIIGMLLGTYVAYDAVTARPVTTCHSSYCP